MFVNIQTTLGVGKNGCCIRSKFHLRVFCRHRLAPVVLLVPPSACFSRLSNFRREFTKWWTLKIGEKNTRSFKKTSPLSNPCREEDMSFRTSLHFQLPCYSKSRQNKQLQKTTRFSEEKPGFQKAYGKYGICVLIRVLYGFVWVPGSKSRFFNRKPVFSTSSNSTWKSKSRRLEATWYPPKNILVVNAGYKFWALNC